MKRFWGGGGGGGDKYLVLIAGTVLPALTFDCGYMQKQSIMAD